MHFPALTHYAPWRSGLDRRAQFVHALLFPYRHFFYVGGLWEGGEGDRPQGLFVALNRNRNRNLHVFSWDMNRKAELRGSTTQRKLTMPDSPKGLKDNNTHTHKYHTTPAPAHSTPPRSVLLCTARTPTSTRRNGCCVIWVCGFVFVLVRVRVRATVSGEISPTPPMGAQPRHRTSKY